MRIIKLGTKPGEAWFQGECKRCGTVIEVKEKETQVASQYNEWYRFVACPVCTATIIVESGV